MKLKYLVVMLLALLIILAAILFLVKLNYSPTFFQEIDFEAKIVEEKNIGFNVANDKLYFGKIPQKSGASFRTVMISNTANYRQEFSWFVSSQDNLANNVVVKPASSWILEANETREFEVYFYAKGLKPGFYEGKILVYRQKALFWKENPDEYRSLEYTVFNKDFLTSIRYTFVWINACDKKWLTSSLDENYAIPGYKRRAWDL